MNGLWDNIFNKVTCRGFSVTKHSFLRLTNEARHAESAIDESRAACDPHDLHHHRLARTGDRSRSRTDRARPVHFTSTYLTRTRRRWSRFSCKRSGSCSFSRSPKRSPLDRPSDCKSKTVGVKGVKDTQHTKHSKGAEATCSPTRHNRAVKESSGEEARCWNCGSDDHYKRDCPQLHSHQCD
jgi:hypothetical protein